MKSILTSIKKMLGIEADYTHFDPDIIVSINTALMTLCQLGVGPSSGFSILGDTETWSNFLGGVTNLEAVKSYVYIRVKLAFDPPSQSALIDSYKRQADEYEWRLQVQTDLLSEEV